MKLWFVAALIGIGGLVGCRQAQSSGTSPTPEETPASLSSEECEKAGGTVVGGADTCPEGQESLGKVSGMRCKCMCCRPKKDD